MLASSCQKPHDHIKKTVPFKAEFATTAIIVQAGPPELDSITGQGDGSPVGKSSLIAQSQFDADGNLTGTLIFTTANGDKIFCTDQGHAPDIDENGDITLHFESTIKGGAGKFAGATGTLSATALGSIYTSEGSVSFDGTITY